MYKDFRNSMSRKRYVKMMRAKLTVAYIHGVIDKETLNQFYKRLRGDTDNWVIRMASANGYPKNYRVNYNDYYWLAAERALVDKSTFAHENF